MNKFILFTFLLVFFGTNYSNAQNEILAAELDDFIIAQMAQKSIPGLSACIVKEGQVVWKQAYGLANIAENKPVTLETEFTLASISKLFTATACAQLWEEGRLDIDEDINNYIPIPIINPNFPNEPITVRQLLNHKSSLHDSESDLQLWDNLGDPLYSLEAFCSAYFVVGGDLYLASNFGNTTPGNSNYWYSNAGFTLLGYIVEKVSGMKFNDYCQEKILAPLQMNNAAWFYAALDTSNIAMPYSSNLQPYGYYSVPEYPAAMLKSNVEDLSHFLIAYTQRGRFGTVQLVDSTTFSTIVPENMEDGFGWWGTDTWWGDPTGDFWSHGGFMNGVRTQLNYYPSDSSGLIILTNGEGSYLPIQNKLEAYIPLFEVDNITSVLNQKHHPVEIFPNPISNQGVLFVKIPINKTQVEISITNLSGNLMEAKEYTAQTFSIDISNYPKGLYFLNIKGNDLIANKKFLVQ